MDSTINTHTHTHTTSTEHDLRYGGKWQILWLWTMERVGPFICKAFCYHFPLVSEYGWIVYLYVTVYWKNTSAFWWLHCGSCLSILAPILSKVIAELENVVIQIDIVNTRGREWVFTALCFIWGLRQLLEQYHLCLDQFKSKTFCKAEPCNENYSLHEGHFASRMLWPLSDWILTENLNEKWCLRFH